MKYDMRDLYASDMGAVCKILSGIGLKEFQPIFKNAEIKRGMTTEQIGYSVMFDIAGIVLENIPKVQKDVDLFLSSLINKDLEEVQKMKLGDYGDLIVQVVTKEDFKDFFDAVMKLFNSRAT